MQELSQIAVGTIVLTLAGSGLMTLILPTMMYFNEQTRQVLSDVGMVFALLALLIAVSI